jgi:hypothetical protein
MPVESKLAGPSTGRAISERLSLASQNNNAKNGQEWQSHSTGWVGARDRVHHTESEQKSSTKSLYRLRLEQVYLRNARFRAMCTTPVSTINRAR